MIHFLINLWHRRQRELDVDIFWPECKRVSRNLDVARVAFAYHAFHDSAWLCLGEERIAQIIDNLE